MFEVRFGFKSGVKLFFHFLIHVVMKKLTKILLAAGGAALIGSGSVVTYLKAQTPMSAQEKLTLANIETLAVGKDLESESSCDGWFGWCSFNCDCGYSYSALGSTFVNRHHCSKN